MAVVSRPRADDLRQVAHARFTACPKPRNALAATAGEGCLGGTTPITRAAADSSLPARSLCRSALPSIARRISISVPGCPAGPQSRPFYPSRVFPDSPITLRHRRSFRCDAIPSYPTTLDANRPLKSQHALPNPLHFLWFNCLCDSVVLMRWMLIGQTPSGFIPPP